MNEGTKGDVLTFLMSLYDDARPGFRFWSKGNSTLLSTCFGIQLAYLINALPTMEFKCVTEYIKSQQRDDGLFVDETFIITDLKGLQSEKYLYWQFTFFALIALDMLGKRPDKPLIFLESIMHERKLQKWFEDRNWTDFWYASNEIMFLMYFLTFKRDRLGEAKETCSKCIDIIFDILDQRQDSVTGFWGDNVSVDWLNGMYGAAHIYLFYDYHQRDLFYTEKIIDNTISLQLANGLYGKLEGGACEDYDAVEVLSRMLRFSHKRELDIRESMVKTYKTIQNGQDLGGGFPYCLKQHSSRHYLKYMLMHLRGYDSYCYSGWSRMKCYLFTPDLWGTYFRVLTMAIIEKSLGLELSYNYKFYALPGWGYYRSTAPKKIKQ